MEKTSITTTTTLTATRPFIICADGTKRYLGGEPLDGAASVARRAVGGRSTNFPRGLHELSEARGDVLGRIDIVAVADARKHLGKLAKHKPMGEEERNELRQARRARRIERGEI